MVLGWAKFRLARAMVFCYIVFMGTFSTKCQIENHRKPTKSIVVGKLLVDSGSEYTWISEARLRRIDVKVQKKDLVFQMANGERIMRDVGFAVIRLDKYFTIDEVVFARRGDLQLLGARTLEGLNLMINARDKKLVSAGPYTVA